MLAKTLTLNFVSHGRVLEMKLKVKDGSDPDAVATAIRNRFQLPDAVRLKMVKHAQ